MPTELLIWQKTEGNFGLARKKWLETLAEIRALPTLSKP